MQNTLDIRRNDQSPAQPARASRTVTINARLRGPRLVGESAIEIPQYMAEQKVHKMLGMVPAPESRLTLRVGADPIAMLSRIWRNGKYVYIVDRLGKRIKYIERYLINGFVTSSPVYSGSSTVRVATADFRITQGADQ